jgi:hypothetical protein
MVPQILVEGGAGGSSRGNLLTAWRAQMISQNYFSYLCQWEAFFAMYFCLKKFLIITGGIDKWKTNRNK